VNKAILVAGGACVASLAAGATGGYLFAKNKLGKAFDARMDAELATIRKRHAIQLQEARQKPSLDDLEPTPTKLKSSAELLGEHMGVSVDNLVGPKVVEEEAPAPEELERRKKLEQRGKAALTDYAGISTQNGNGNDTLSTENIFRTDKKQHPPLPPRDGVTGKFIPRPKDEIPEEGPYLIDETMFLANVQEHHQRSLLWFVRNQVLCEKLDGEVDDFDIDRVGGLDEDGVCQNLTKFDEKIPKDEPNYIYIRNDDLEEDYQVQLVFGTLEEYMGMGEYDEDVETGNLRHHN